MPRSALTVPTLILLLATAVPADDPVPTDHGKEVFLRDCSACHGEFGTGTGRTAGLPRLPRDFIEGKIKLKSSPEGEPPTREDVLAVVKRGIPRSGMPGFTFLPPEDLEAVVDHVFELMKVEPGNPIPVPSDPGPTPAVLARGARLYREVRCNACHQPDLDRARREPLRTHRGRKIDPPHLVRDAFIGPATPREIFLRLTTGMAGTPMPAYPTLDDDDRWALAHHVTSIHAPIVDPLPRKVRYAGEVIVRKYACRACHRIGKRGGVVGPDLDIQASKLRESWIRRQLTDPRSLPHVWNDRPYRMPALPLSEEEVEILVQYLPSLGRRNRRQEEKVPELDPDKIRRGEAIYREKRCQRCHDLGDVIPCASGSPTGPDLLHVARRTDWNWLYTINLAENLDPESADLVREFLWDASLRAGPSSDPEGKGP